MLSAQLLDELTIPNGFEVEAGSPFRKWWRLQNNGRDTWQGCRLMRRGGTLQTAITWQPVPETAAGQETAVFAETIAPTQPGRYADQWQLHDGQGQPFGPLLTVEIIVTPTGFQNGRLHQTDTTIEQSQVRHLLTLENSGGRRWQADDQLVYLGGDLEPVQTRYGLPATIPGDQNQLEIMLKRGTFSGQAVTFWQFRDAAEIAFGGIVAPEVALTAPAPTTRFDPAAWRSTIFDITSIFESGRVGGNPAAYQNSDDGIVSYGKHQATLQSGNLGRVIAHFCQHSSSPTSRALQQEYLGRLQALDASLRHDQRLRDLLIAAATEPEMGAAQDAIFGTCFFDPAVALAQSLGIASALGLACLYDTRIQHGSSGLDFIISLTRDSGMLPPAESGGQTAEPTWLAALLQEREALLNRLADKRQHEASLTTDATRQRSLLQTAEALRISTFRVRELRSLLQNGNLALAGPFTVRGQRVQGVREA